MMKRTRLYIGIFLLLALAGCSSERFPGCCGSTGNRDVPFSETVLFDFKTGAGAITKENPDGNLQIISSADLLTLLAAAQDTQNLGTGVVSGLVLFNGAPVQDVSLKATDSEGRLLAIRTEGRKVGNNLILPDGMVCPPDLVSFDNICIKGSIYYNSPGGVPDFSNNKGTATTGTFTIFNLPPGDVYLWASRGGRGTSRIRVFENKISVGKIQVIPIPISTVGITGSVVEARDESTLVPAATISIQGTTDPGLTTVSDASGLYTIVSIGTNGNYLMKVSKAGYWPSYHGLNTLPFQATNDVPDVTRTVSAFSNSYIEGLPKSAGNVSRNLPKPNPGLGIITGRVKGGDGTPQHCAKLTGNGAGVTNADGEDLTLRGAVVVYVDGSRDDCESKVDVEQTSTNGLFLIYNIPSDVPEVFIKYITRPRPLNAGSSEPTPVVSGGMIAPAIPGAVFVQDMINSGNGRTQELSGLMTNEHDDRIADAKISILGIQAAYTYQYSDDGGGTFTEFTDAEAVSKSAPLPGEYRIPQNADEEGRIPLIGGMTYRIRTSDGIHADTYQLVNMAGAITKQNLLISSKPRFSDPEMGEVHGNVIDQVTGKLAEKVTLKVTDLNGNPVGGGEITAPEGIFEISNVPSKNIPGGLINLSVVSGDDSGNAVVRVYPNGITFLEFSIAKVVPAQVPVSGTVKDFDGTTAVNQARLKIHGRTDLISTDGDGRYNTNLESFGRFVIKSEKTGFYDTYNFFPTSGILDGSSNLDLFSISRDPIKAIATSANVTIDPAMGMIAGTTVENSFDSRLCGGCLNDESHSAVLGFFNEDSQVDIAITNADTNTVHVFFGKETDGSDAGIFEVANRKAFADRIGPSPSAIATGNFDGNGNLDLVIANRGASSTQDGITVLLGDKNGNFTPVASPVVDNDQKPLTNSPLNAPVALAVGLFDSDTFSDVAVVNQTDVVVLLGNGNGTFRPIVQNNTVVKNSLGQNPSAIVAGDFNQDNRLDMAISNEGDNSISVFLGSTDGTFQPLSDPNTGSPIVIQGVPNPRALALLDVNSDGRLDLAAMNRSVEGTVTILIGNVSGGFDPLKDPNGRTRPPVIVGAGPSAMTIGEFNGDNRVDLAVTRDNQAFLILLGNGDGTFTVSPPLSLGLAGPPQQILLQDVDRNGLFDLIVVGSTWTEMLMGQEKPVGGIAVEARDLDGNRVGTVIYPNGASTGSTDADGRFVIFNVPPGLTVVRNTSQGAGNKVVDLYPDSVSYTKIKTLSVQPFFVSVQGVTYDPVGPPPAGVPVGGVSIHLFGMDVKTKSDPTTGNYKFDVDANSEYILRLFFDILPSPTP